MLDFKFKIEKGNTYLVMFSLVLHSEKKENGNGLPTRNKPLTQVRRQGINM